MSEAHPFHPADLLDAIIGLKNLKNDAALCRLLGVAPPMISKIRHGRLPIGASLLIRMHEETDLTIKALRELMGDRRQRHRVSGTSGQQRADDGRE
ncbi:MAG: hypothetical protein M3N23_12220 [Pseudomonadota bacterium]|nr:hypothetical protein [Pseudomonadota bacterium]